MTTDTKIYLVLCTVDEGKERDGVPDGKFRTIVSHGIGNISFRNYVLPNEPVKYFNPSYDEGGWFISCEEETDEN